MEVFFRHLLTVSPMSPIARYDYESPVRNEESQESEKMGKKWQNRVITVNFSVFIVGKQQNSCLPSSFGHTS